MPFALQITPPRRFVPWKMSNSKRAARLMKDMGKRLRACRIAAGFSEASDLAKLLDVDPPRYRKYERGQSMMPLDLLEQICDVLKTTSDFLLLDRKS